MSEPVRNLLSWLKTELQPLGMNAITVLGSTEFPVPDYWQIPPLLGALTNVEGQTARQLATGNLATARLATQDDFAKACAWFLAARNPARAALAHLDTDWSPLRAYLLPHGTTLGPHLLALQLATAFRDFTAAGELTRGDTYLTLTSKFAFGVFEGRPLGKKTGPRVTQEDLDSMLTSPRRIRLEGVLPEVVQLQQYVLNGWHRIEQPEYALDVVALLGVLTRRSWGYDGSALAKEELEFNAQAFRQAIRDAWDPAKEKKPRAPSTAVKKSLAEQVQKLQTKLKAFTDAADVVTDDVPTTVKLTLIHRILVPEVWSASTFKTRITSQNLQSLPLTEDLCLKLQLAFTSSIELLRLQIKALQKRQLSET